MRVCDFCFKLLFKCPKKCAELPKHLDLIVTFFTLLSSEFMRFQKFVSFWIITSNRKKKSVVTIN